MPRPSSTAGGWFIYAPRLRARRRDWETFFAHEGWRLVSMRYHVEEGERRGRRAPLPAWFRLAYALMPKKRKEGVRKMMGFGLLEKAAATTGLHGG